MVAPIDYTLQGVQSPFQAFLQAAQVGAGLSQAQLQRQQFEAQMAQQQQEAAAKSAQQTELQQLQAVPMEQMTQPQMLRLAQLTGSEATRAYLFRAAERIPAERQTGLARNYGSTILALVRNPQIGVKRLETLAEAEQDPEQKKALTALIETAKVDPLAAAKWGVDMMDMGGGKFSEVGQALRKALGAEFGAEEKPMVVGGSVFYPKTREFIQAPATPAKPTPGETEELVMRLQDPNLPAASRKALEDRLKVLTTREPKEPREREEKLVQATDPVTGQTVFATNEEIRKRGLVPPSGFQGLSPKAIQEREAAFPQARQAVLTVGNTMTLIEETVDRLLKNKDGLNSITGLVGGRIPGITDAGRAAEADLKQLKSLAFVQGITELRNASKTGAGVGNVSNKEGDRFENLKASLERTQSRADLEDALRRLSSQAAATREGMRTAFDDTYEYRQRGTGQATPAGAAPAPRALTAEDRQALDWASKNPTDPRAAQIRQRLGM
jgi:hypothetical protein